MIRRVTTWLLGGTLALTATAWAQAPPADTTSDRHGKVTREEVKTWTAEFGGKEYEVHPGTPTYEGTTGLFHVPSAYTLPKGKFSFSLFRDNLDRDPKDLDISIHGLSIGYGASDKFELFGNFGLQNRIDADALFQAGFQNDFPFVSTPWETGVGDIKLGVKYKFLDDYRGDGVGLAVRALVKLPTADEAKGLGTGKTSFGGDIIISKSLAEKADIHAQLGYMINSDPDGADIGNAFKWGIGINLPACYWAQLQAEVQGTNYTGDDSFPQTNPVDFVIGPVFWIKTGWFIRPAISWNLNFNDRGLDSGVASYTGRHLSIGYHPGTPCREIYVPPPPEPAKPNGNPTVSCEVERSTLLPGESTGVRATASDPEGDPLSYSWSASAGTVSGSGPAVTFNSTGVAPGSSASITVRVSDGRGGSAQASCPVRVNAPEARRPEAVTCVSEGFPPNRARLNNVDKACLDDVASKLKQDPRSRVIVVGFADAKERRPDVLARQRGEAVKTYLVKNQGIEESRITVRTKTAAGADPAEQKRNRRVEVVFVPEGASVPAGIE
jgi:outer membrane protein OmpA-like peptidoglycan-associated protein